jgi:hypothetical protein
LMRIGGPGVSWKIIVEAWIADWVGIGGVLGDALLAWILRPVSWGNFSSVRFLPTLAIYPVLRSKDGFSWPLDCFLCRLW